MFNELLNINIKAYSVVKLRELVDQTNPIVVLHAQATEELLRRYDNNAVQIAIHEESSNILKIAFENGHRLSQEKLSNINEDDFFDVIFDATTNSLRFRKNPSKHTALQESKLEHIGGHRMRILAYMLEHPGVPFYYRNIYKDYSLSAEIKGPSTFSKTIAALRNAFEQKDTSGPYIIKQSDGEGVTRSKKGCIYMINSKLRYLIIRHNPKYFRANSGIGQS
ncbi:MAG: hypothetical protein WC770_03935 [Phycisphaerae bacterium]